MRTEERLFLRPGLSSLRLCGPSPQLKARNSLNSHGNFHHFPSSVCSSQPHLFLSPAGSRVLSVGRKGLGSWGNDSCLSPLPPPEQLLLGDFLQAQGAGLE